MTPWPCRDSPESAAAAQMAESKRCQPDFNKSLPITCSLPGNTLVDFANCGTQIYSDDRTFHLFLFTSLPSFASKQPWVVISSTLLSHRLQKHRENQNTVGRETQAGLNTNINHAKGVGLGTILFFTSHYLKCTTTSELQKTPPRLHCEMEARVTRGSHPPASLPPNSSLPPWVPRASSQLWSHGHLTSTRRPDPAQKLDVLHRGTCRGSTSPMSLYRLNNSCCWPPSI